MNDWNLSQDLDFKFILLKTRMNKNLWTRSLHLTQTGSGFNFKIMQFTAMMNFEVSFDHYHYHKLFLYGPNWNDSPSCSHIEVILSIIWDKTQRKPLVSTDERTHVSVAFLVRIHGSRTCSCPKSRPFLSAP